MIKYRISVPRRLSSEWWLDILFRGLHGKVCMDSFDSESLRFIKRTPVCRLGADSDFVWSRQASREGR